MKNILTINEKTVTKRFHSHIACRKEWHILKLLENSGLCPAPIKNENNTIETRLAEGLTLAQVLDINCNLPHIFEKLTQWMLRFNRRTGNIVLADINLKNFIYNPDTDRITGIDFESWHTGDNIYNLAAVCAMIAESRFTGQEMQTDIYIKTKQSIIDAGVCSEDILDDFTAVCRKNISLRRSVMPLIRKSDCVIIAGGKSSRMGQPKGLLEYEGFSFIQHIISNTSVFDRQYISANSDIYNNLGCEIITDNYKDTGPVGALQATIARSSSEYVFFIPCDMPFISEETVYHLYSKIEKGTDAAVFTADGRVFPTVGIYRKTALPAIEQQIQCKNYRLMNLLEKLNTVFVQRPFPEQFCNINTPKDYEEIIIQKNGTV